MIEATLGRFSTRSVALVVALAVLAAACGDDGSIALDADSDAGTGGGLVTPDDTDAPDDTGVGAGDTEAGAGDGTGDGADAGTSSVDGTGGEPAAEDGTPGPTDAPEVTIIDPGSEPRTELRMRLAGPVTGTLVSTQTQTIEQEIDGAPAPQIGPVSIVMTLAVEATPSDDGTIELRTEVTAAEPGDDVDPVTAAQVAPGLAQMVGTTFEATVDDRGRSLASDVAWSTGGDDEVLGLVDQMANSPQSSVPLPDEPVGVGAVWEVKQRIPVGGITLESSSRYRLESFDGDVVSLSTEVEQRVEPGSTMSVGDISLLVESWHVTGSGSAIFDPRTVLITSDARSTASQRLSGGGQVIDQRIETSLTLTPG